MELSKTVEQWLASGDRVCFNDLVTPVQDREIRDLFERAYGPFSSGEFDGPTWANKEHGQFIDRVLLLVRSGYRPDLVAWAREWCGPDLED